MSLDRIARLFQESEFKWKFKDGYRVPTFEEIGDAVNRAIVTIADEPDLTQIEFGRLIVQKTAGHYDVYVHAYEVEIDPDRG